MIDPLIELRFVPYSIVSKFNDLRAK